MASFIQKEIDSFLHSSYFVNTNHREQNLQGRLYAYLLHLEQDGYVVEMETNIKSEEYSELFKDTRYRDSLLKSEVDILIYRPKNPLKPKQKERLKVLLTTSVKDLSAPDQKEIKELSKKHFEDVYVIELKWFYSPEFHYFDRYQEFAEDVAFVKQLKDNHTDITETAALTFVERILETIPSKRRKWYGDVLKPFEYNSANTQAAFRPLPIEKYTRKSEEISNEIIKSADVKFEWKSWPNKTALEEQDKYLYYLITF